MMKDMMTELRAVMSVRHDATRPDAVAQHAAYHANGSNAKQGQWLQRQAMASTCGEF